MNKLKFSFLRDQKNIFKCPAELPIHTEISNGSNSKT